MSESHDHAAFIAPEPAELAPLFPGYEIQGLIATGGMGAVYRAVQKSLDRTVALKILPREFSRDAAFCAGFEAEAKAMARLNHANLIGVYDFGEADGMLYIIMEYVPGQSLYHLAYGQAVEQREVVRLISAICSGLGHAHENGILHRDIKPSNILLDLNNHPKIGDFGLARPADRKAEEGEEIFGTPHYTAPEVVNAPQSVDHRADLFSVGVMLHELLTGQLPAADPRPASTLIRCDTRFDAIIKRATQPLAAARYSSAGEMAHDLQAIGTSLNARSGHAAGPVAPRRPATAYRPVYQKKSSAAPVILLLAGGAAAVAAYLHFSKPEKPAPDTAPKVEVMTDTPKPTLEIPPPSTSGRPAPRPTPRESTPGTSTPFGSTTPPKTDESGTTADSGTPIGTYDPASAPDLPPAKFDVPAFFTRARKIMREQAKPALTTHNAGLRDNLYTYEREVTRAISGLRNGREPLQKALAQSSATWKADGCHIPATVPSDLSELEGIQGIQDKAVSRQTGFDDTLHQALDTLSATYILGIEKQIERLQGTDDPGGVGRLQNEIKQTKADPIYFRGLMTSGS